MTKTPGRPALAAGRALPFLLIAGACSLSPQPDLSRFYMLTAAREAPEVSTAATSDLSVGVGPVSFPGYLVRPQLVTRVGQNEVRISQNDRWAEPIERGFVRTLAENLESLLGTERIVLHPWYGSTSLDFSVRLEVHRFEADTLGTVTLDSHWFLEDGAGERLVDRESDYRETADGDDVGARVAAQSRALGRLSREIAEEIRSAAANDRVRSSGRGARGAGGSPTPGS